MQRSHFLVNPSDHTQSYSVSVQRYLRIADVDPNNSDRTALKCEVIATLDSDFDIYRRYRKQPFERVFLPG